tara:strand:- start:390 stop:563 length:174 start_codon:yes stop_codon:yes gene_type:complete
MEDQNLLLEISEILNNSGAHIQLQSLFESASLNGNDCENLGAEIEHLILDALIEKLN